MLMTEQIAATSEKDKKKGRKGPKGKWRDKKEGQKITLGLRLTHLAVARGTYEYKNGLQFRERREGSGRHCGKKAKARTQGVMRVDGVKILGGEGKELPIHLGCRGRN